LDVRQDRHLKHDRHEQQRRRLRDVRGNHGAAGTRFLVTSAVTESSEPKSTFGSIWMVLKYAVSVWPTLATLPIAIPGGKSDGYCFDNVPDVVIASPERTFRFLGTRSRISCPWLWPWRTSPIAPVCRSRAGTADS